MIAKPIACPDPRSRAEAGPAAARCEMRPTMNDRLRSLMPSAISRPALPSPLPAKWTIGCAGPRTGKWPAPPPLEPFVPFPSDVLPEPVRSFVTGAAGAVGCDPSFVALPLLAALAAAIGNRRRIALKPGWSEPAIVWAAVVGESGSKKSPAMERALSPTRQKQVETMNRHRQAMAEYQPKVLQWEKDLGLWKRCRSDEAPPERPVEPVAQRWWADDTTVEALAVLLQQNPGGLLLARDELSGWLNSFDQYKSGNGGDVARWIEMFGGRPMVVDRKSGNPRTICVPRAAVSLCGGIQPAILARALGRKYRENGLAARLLLAWPPWQPKQWSEAGVSPELEARIAALLGRLYELVPATDENGDAQPVLVPLSEDGKSEWVKFYNAHGQEQANLSGDLSAAWSKLEGYAARFALIFHLVRCADDDPTLADAGAIDARSVLAGAALSRWFGNEARRVYAMLDESDDERDCRELVDLIQRKGGSISCREVVQSSRKYRTVDDAHAALGALAQGGYGSWQTPGQHGPGAPRAKRFVLTRGVDVHIDPAAAVSAGTSASDPREARARIDHGDAADLLAEPDAPGIPSVVPLTLAKWV